MLSPEVQTSCRLIDRVAFKGSGKMLEVYTYDLPDSTHAAASVASDQQLSVHKFFELMGGKYPEDFSVTFQKGIRLYLGDRGGAGADWVQATKLLNKCLELRPGDTPSESALAYIKQHAGADGACPADWKGFRNLTEK
mmetsp:Transcript_17686/g.27363  ORF Transcript_17686/g.27363 Transcript_17686/m.27363 type:complete len:138 (-) Transcript_17686:63-476(-)